jgi:hypothetical protein
MWGPKILGFALSTGSFARSSRVGGGGRGREQPFGDGGGSEAEGAAEGGAEGERQPSAPYRISTSDAPGGLTGGGGGAALLPAAAQAALL